MDNISALVAELPLQWTELIYGWGGVVLRLILIIILARLVLRFGYSFIERVFKERDRGITLGTKAETFSGLFKSLWRYLVVFMAILMILREFNMDLTPVIAGAGIAGLAVGFGAQNLVRDVITGFFIIIEDQFSVGDHVTVGLHSGIVEQVGLRVTKIRDFGGEEHIFPNGKIEIVTNHSKGPQRALVDVSVAYEEDVDYVLGVLREHCAWFAGEYPELEEGPSVLGVAELGDSEVVIRIIARSKPLQQWYIERELRRTIKNRFVSLDIEIPYPRRVLLAHGEKEDIPPLKGKSKEEPNKGQDKG